MPAYGSLVLEIEADMDIDALFDGTKYELIGYTQKDRWITIGDENIALDEAIDTWQSPLEDVFPTKTQVKGNPPKEYTYKGGSKEGAVHGYKA